MLAAIARLYRQKIEHLRADAAHSERATEFHWKAREAYEKGRKALERRIVDLATAPLLVELGKLHLAMADQDAARTCFAKALDIDKESPEACFMLAHALLGAEDFKAARSLRRPQRRSIRTTWTPAPRWPMCTRS